MSPVGCRHSNIDVQPFTRCARSTHWHPSLTTAGTKTEALAFSVGKAEARRRCTCTLPCDSRRVLVGCMPRRQGNGRAGDQCPLKPPLSVGGRCARSLAVTWHGVDRRGARHRFEPDARPWLPPAAERRRWQRRDARHRWDDRALRRGADGRPAAIRRTRWVPHCLRRRRLSRSALERTERRPAILRGFFRGALSGAHGLRRQLRALRSPRPCCPWPNAVGATRWSHHAPRNGPASPEPLDSVQN